MKAKDLAALLHGIPFDDIPSDLDHDAKRSGLVVVIGIDDANVRFYGAVRGVADVLDGGPIYFDAEGILPDVEDVKPEDERAYYDRKRLAVLVDAEWNKDGFAWIFSTIVPHKRFVVTADGERYCRGIVFSLVDTGLSPVQE